MSIAYVAVGTTVASVASTQLASRQQRKGIERGAQAEERIASENIALQRELNEQQREDFAPWRDVGQQALDQLWSGVQGGEFVTENVDVTEDPGYQFRLDEGIKALDRSASARGRMGSGAQDKAITRYAQNYASDEYARAYARDQDRKARRFNILSGLSGQGQASAARQAGATSQLASNVGNILSTQGRQQNVAQQNIGTARASGYQDLAKSLNQGASNYLTYQLLS